jgi:hypothetical protein
MAGASPCCRAVAVERGSHRAVVTVEWPARGGGGGVDAELGMRVVRMWRRP